MFPAISFLKIFAQALVIQWLVCSCAGAQSLTLRKTIKAHEEPVYRAIFSPDGSLLFTQSKTSLLWDLSSEKSTDVGVGLDPLMFSSDGSGLVLTNEMHDIRYYDISSGKMNVYTGAPDDVFCALSRDGKRQYFYNKTKRNSYSVGILKEPYDISTNESTVALNVLSGMSSRWTRPAFAANGKVLVAQDDKGLVTAYNVATGAGVSLEGSSGNGFVLSPSGSHVLVECLETLERGKRSKQQVKSQKVFDTNTGRVKSTLETRFVDTATFSPAEDVIAFGEIAKIVTCSVKTGKIASKFEASALKPRQILFLCGGELVLAFGGTTTTPAHFRLWETKSGKVVDSIPNIDKVLAVSEDGLAFAGADAFGNVQIYDVRGKAKKQK